MMAHTFAEASEILDKMTKTTRAWHTRESKATAIIYSRGMIVEQHKKEEERDQNIAHRKTQIEEITKNLATLNTQRVHVVNAQEKGLRDEGHYPDAKRKQTLMRKNTPCSAPSSVMCSTSNTWIIMTCKLARTGSDMTRSKTCAWIAASRGRILGMKILRVKRVDPTHGMLLKANPNFSPHFHARSTPHILSKFSKKTSSFLQIPPNFFTQIIKDITFLGISSAVAPKDSKGKGVASLNHGNKRSRMVQ
ncbi:hypothetical protein HAX54_037391 [Datura stramonium]|uniref:Uncharacterized protein n=1 Tax=Datura stramonium TaxID=4076 RepID=A0ABS8VJM2_DATST|nr:hypothetical protein [Datura stramonium]